MHDRTWYRHPMYKDSHLATSGSTALCGRELLFDEMWWIDSGWEEEAGPLMLIVDERKQGKCTQCKNMLKAIDEEDKWWAGAEKPHPSPFRPDEEEKIRAWQRVERQKQRSLAAWLAREFGGDVLG